MKRIAYMITGLVLSVTFAMAQESSSNTIPLLGETAPSFTAESTNGTIVFPKDFGNSWKIIFSHPADFTPVCSSEILELAAIQDDLKKMNVKIAIVSTDNLDSHKQWIKSLESLDYKNRKTPAITFPFIDDHDRSIAKKYGMIQNSLSTTKAVRGVFIIDPQDKIRLVTFYPMELGRNIEEIKRAVLALQTADKNHVLTPANWQVGNDVLLPYTKTAGDSKGSAPKSDDPNVYQVIWYMTFKKM
jgi:peroxiredoxin 2/4